jgi:hypothetical protein
MLLHLPIPVHATPPMLDVFMTVSVWLLKYDSMSMHLVTFPLRIRPWFSERAGILSLRLSAPPIRRGELGQRYYPSRTMLG